MAYSSFDFEQGQRPNPEPYLVTEVHDLKEFEDLNRIVNFVMRYTHTQYEQIGSVHASRLLQDGEDPNLRSYPRWLDFVNLYHVRAHNESALHIAHDVLARIPNRAMPSHQKFLTLVGVALHDLIRVNNAEVVAYMDGNYQINRYVRVATRGQDERQSGFLAAQILLNFGYSAQDARFVDRVIAASLPSYDPVIGTVLPAKNVEDMTLSELVMVAADLNLSGRSAEAQSDAEDAVFLEEFRPDSIPFVIDATFRLPDEYDTPWKKYQGFLNDQATRYIPGRRELFWKRELPRFQELGAGAIEEIFNDFEVSAGQAFSKKRDLVSAGPSSRIEEQAFLAHMRPVVDRRLNHSIRPLVYAA